jgi:histidinol-phosphate aminotransferase
MGKASRLTWEAGFPHTGGMNTALKLNQVLANMPVYQPGRPIEDVARELGMRPEHIIKLASNENPLGPSPKAIAAMTKAAAQVHLYPDGNAFYLKQRLAQKLKLDAKQLILGNGSNEIIEFVGHALMAPGVDVVVSQYCFAIYPIVAQLFGARTITVPARNFGHDLPAMLKAVTPKTRVMFVANPNNPTGTLASKKDLLRLIREIPDHVLLVMDEAYVEFLEDAVDTLALVRSGKKPNLLLMRTFSKILGLAGLRLGYGVGAPDLLASLEKIRQPFNINAIAQAGALAALEDERHMRRTRENNTKGLTLYAKAFEKLGLRYLPSSGNFILVHVGQGQKVFEGMQKQGVIVRPMGGYQLPEWVRISVGTPAENKRCLEALKQVLKGV